MWVPIPFSGILRKSDSNIWNFSLTIGDKEAAYTFFFRASKFRVERGIRVWEHKYSRTQTYKRAHTEVIFMSKRKMFGTVRG